MIKEYLKGNTGKGSGKVGELVGGRFNFPIGSANMGYQVRDLYDEFMGNPITKRDYKAKDSFWEGFFKRGFIDLFTPPDENKMSSGEQRRQEQRRNK